MKFRDNDVFVFVWFATEEDPAAAHAHSLDVAAEQIQRHRVRDMPDLITVISRDKDNEPTYVSQAMTWRVFLDIVEAAQT